MNDFDELGRVLAIDHLSTYRFFHTNIREFAPERVTPEEIQHVASVLSSYAQTSTSETGGWAIPTSPIEVEDIIDPNRMSGARAYEIAGARVLFLAGYFRNQIKRRHNVEWLDRLGQSFYAIASDNALGPNNRKVLRSVAMNFPGWTNACMQLNSTFADNRYILKM